MGSSGLPALGRLLPAPAGFLLGAARDSAEVEDGSRGVEADPERQRTGGPGAASPRREPGRTPTCGKSRRQAVTAQGDKDAPRSPEFKSALAQDAVTKLSLVSLFPSSGILFFFFLQDFFKINYKTKQSTP